MCDNKTEQKKFKKLNNELKNILVNKCTNVNHIIINKEDFSKKDLKLAYLDLKCFDYADFEGLLNYEQWLEDCCGDKKR